VSYASQEERDRLIDGLRTLAQFLHDLPDVPAPRYVDVLVFPLKGTDEEERAGSAPILTAAAASDFVLVTQA
jgi:hypothetical protein